MFVLCPWLLPLLAGDLVLCGVSFDLLHCSSGVVSFLDRRFLYWRCFRGSSNVLGSVRVSRSFDSLVLAMPQHQQRSFFDFSFRDYRVSCVCQAGT